MKTYILGGNGFIGKYLSNLIPESEPIVRSNLSALILGNNQKSKFKIINCLANRNISQEDSSKYVNFTLPKEIIERNSGLIVEWIQLSSYYSTDLQQTSFPINAYSKYKSEFSNFLSTCDSFKIFDFQLPHIYHPLENSNRLISRIVKNHKYNLPFDLYSIDQELPILNLDLLYGELFENGRDEDVLNYKIAKVPAELILNVREFLDACNDFFGLSPEITDSKTKGPHFRKFENWPAKIVDKSDKDVFFKDLISKYLESI